MSASVYLDSVSRLPRSREVVVTRESAVELHSPLHPGTFKDGMYDRLRVSLEVHGVTTNTVEIRVKTERPRSGDSDTTELTK